MESINYNDFNNICRACLFNSDLKPLRDNVIIEVLHKIIGVDSATNDDLPQQICLNCFEKIQQIHEFSLRCKQSHCRLINCLNNYKKSEDEQEYKNVGLNNEQEFIKDPEPEINELIKIKEEIDIEEHKIEFIPVDDNQFNELKIKQETTNNDANEETNIQNINSSNIDFDEDTTSSSSSINTNSPENKKKYTCDVCNKKFTHLTSFKRHKSTHSGERPFTCDVCHKSFPIEATLKLHKRLHSDERPHKCDQCPMTFTESFYLKRHQRWHSDERPFQCNVCPRSFKFSHVLVEHQRIHNGDRPYECDVCKKLYKCSSNLIRHKKIHGGERPHRCDICNKSFIDSSNLAKHRKIHEQK